MAGRRRADRAIASRWLGRHLGRLSGRIRAGVSIFQRGDCHAGFQVHIQAVGQAGFYDYQTTPKRAFDGYGSQRPKMLYRRDAVRSSGGLKLSSLNTPPGGSDMTELLLHLISQRRPVTVRVGDTVRDGGCNGCATAVRKVWVIHIGSIEVRVCDACRRALRKGLQ